VGPFDEGYRLYFEETDWLLRARRKGLASRYVPAAEAVHLYGQSARREPRAAAWFEESARRFRRRHYGGWFVALLAGLDRLLPAARPAAAPPLPPEGLSLPAEPAAYPLWIEVSPSPAGFPAAAERLTGPGRGRWELAEILERMPAAELTVRATTADGREVSRCSRLGGA
jgi:hypothetical protein